MRVTRISMWPTDVRPISVLSVELKNGLVLNCANIKSERVLAAKIVDVILDHLIGEGVV